MNMSQEYRRFGNQENALATSWATEVVSSIPWTLEGPVGLGVSQSHWARRQDGIRAVAKEAFNAQGVAQGAHERIASVLALTLGLPVPAVQLWQHSQTGTLYSMSVAAFTQSMNWDQLAATLTAEFRQNVLPALAAGYVFHTWICDTDHGGNGGNVLIDGASSDDHPSIAFIDHAFSMSYQWSPAMPCHPLGGYYCDVATLPRAAIDDVVGKIERLEDAVIEEVVSQIPVEYLPEPTAKIILECLTSRKRDLRQAFTSP